MEFKKDKLGHVKFTETEAKYIIVKSREIIAAEPTLLEIEGPLIICGDIHGQFRDLLRILERCGKPPAVRYLFLGDYVDRGSHSMETTLLLFAFKILYPDRIFLLRGNHEIAYINRLYGFFDECKRRYSVGLWRLFCDCFDYLPLAAVISKRIICMHGGLSPELNTLEDIRRVVRPVMVPDDGLLCDLLWSDPEHQDHPWLMSPRGVSFTFNETAVEHFLRHNNLDLICRAHQVQEHGYEFFANRQLVTVFSAPNYCNQFDNQGAVMRVTDELVCSFEIFHPILPPGWKRPPDLSYTL